MPIKSDKDPWWMVFKILVFFLLAISIWSTTVIPPKQHQEPTNQRK